MNTRNSLSARAPPSRASASTQCQKCLQRGHYSYECTTRAQDRPYVSRPSRTAQLRNPKLKPALTEAKPAAGADGVADAILKRIDDERRREREDSEDSVDTISTGAGSPRRRSRSLSRSRRREEADNSEEEPGAGMNRRLRSRSRSGSPGGSRRRRRRSRSGSAPREAERRGAGRRSASPERKRERGREDERVRERYGREGLAGRAPRQRSLSPFSKRLALTQAMNS